jgi:organic radical activating enzyme
MINQFEESSIKKIQDEIRNIGGKILKPTVSLCHKCHYHIPAYRYELNDSVYICKHCVTHKLSHHMIERSASFYHSIKKTNPDIGYDGRVLIEVTDRCNLECPHCYHLPDNKIKDKPREQIIDDIKKFPKSIHCVVLAGAEPTLRKDFIELAKDIKGLGFSVDVLTNGVKLSDNDFVQKLVSNGLSDVLFNVGLNHPEYIGNKTIRSKQEQGIRNAREYLQLGYISYTLVNKDELTYVLNEIVDKNRQPRQYRIRCGSEIGRNASSEPIFLSELYNDTISWANEQQAEVIRLDGDNNIYHQLIDLKKKGNDTSLPHNIRLIHWCDEMNIDMEELRSGPWNAFVPNDGITNFLHQIIRRDLWKNKGIDLPDVPPLRYQINNQQNQIPVNDWTMAL